MHPLLEILIGVGGFAIGGLSALAAFVGWYVQQQRKSFEMEQGFKRINQDLRTVIDGVQLCSRESDRLHREFIEVKGLVLNLQTICGRIEKE